VQVIGSWGLIFSKSEGTEQMIARSSSVLPSSLPKPPCIRSVRQIAEQKRKALLLAISHLGKADYLKGTKHN
jgi:hypothetical protein